MNKFLRIGLVAMSALALTEGLALASKTVIRTKGADGAASFEVQELQSCADGSTAFNTTSVALDMFEATTSTQGAPATVLQSSVSVSRFDGCNFVFSFGFGLFEGVGTLSVTALKTAQLTGHFSLDDGTVLDANLTLTGGDTTSQGTTMRRTIQGKVMTIQRSVGQSSTASVSGTVVVDGRTITAAQATSSTAMIARNTGGEITIIKP